jgi:hypothetical protein
VTDSAVATAKSALSYEIEHFEDFLFRSSAVDADVAYAAKKGEVYFCPTILLVVLHKGKEFVVVLTGEGEDAVYLLDESNGLT